MKCPCHSGKEYNECCQKFHEGELPENALELMRSRYSAYALGKIEYIIETTHPDHPDKQLLESVLREQISYFCKNTAFQDLQILHFEFGQMLSYVTFHAKLHQKGKDISFTEKSTFEKKGNRWLYLRGEI